MPPPFPAIAARADAVHSRSTLPPTIIPERPAAGWLVDAHRIYVGIYGHLLLGNFTVSFQPMTGTPDGGTLLFQVTTYSDILF